MHSSQKTHPILITLLKIQRKYKKNYSWPSQKKILELLEVRQGLKKSRATLNRWLACSQKDKYLLRRRRIKRHPLYGIVFKSTLYKISIKGYRLLARLGVEVSKEIASYQAWLESVSPKRAQERNLISQEFKSIKEVFNDLVPADP